jgi:transcriptional regulator with XRE-family HTH domain
MHFLCHNLGFLTILTPKGIIMHYSELITVLKNRREELGVTQEHLAELAGVGVRTLKEIESGRGNPTVETLGKLAEILGMDLHLVVKKPV